MYLLLLNLCYVVASGQSGEVSQQHQQPSSLSVRQAALLSADRVRQLQMAGRRGQQSRGAELGGALAELDVQVLHKVVPLTLTGGGEGEVRGQQKQGPRHG